MSNTATVSVKKTPLLSDQLYKALHFLAMIALPAAGALYFALAGIWNLPDAQQVVGSIVAVDTFLGVLIGIGNKSYDASNAKYDGEMEIHPEDANGARLFQLNLDGPAENLADKKQVSFKVVPAPPQADPGPGSLPPVPPVQ